MTSVLSRRSHVAMQQAIAYYRVSTARQGKSGLGIEAQPSAVQRFAEAEGYDLAEEFIEVETGEGADALDRPTAGRCFGDRPLTPLSGHSSQARPSVARRGLCGRSHGPTSSIHCCGTGSGCRPRSCCTCTLLWQRKSGV